MREGWTASIIEGHPHCRVFSAPNNDGHVTVDYDRRGWRIGISAYGITHPHSTAPKGRGWRERLENDAMDYLHRVLYEREPQPQRTEKP